MKRGSEERKIEEGVMAKKPAAVGFAVKRATEYRWLTLTRIGNAGGGEEEKEGGTPAEWGDAKSLKLH